MIELSQAGEARAAATERFALEWRDPASWVRSEARARLAGGLWSGPVIEQALDNAFWMIEAGLRKRSVHAEFERYGGRSLHTLVILPGNIIGPALHAAYRVAQTGATAIFKAASAERVLADIVARQWAAIGPPLAGSLEARYWSAGDIGAESRSLAIVDNVIVFGSDETVASVKARVPHGKQFTGYGTSFSVGVVWPGADLVEAAERASVDICMFDQAGCKSPQTIYVAGDGSRALRFAGALDAAMRVTSTRLPRMAPSRQEAAAVNDVVRRSSVTAIAATTHGLSPILAGPNNGGCPDYLIIVESQGLPRTHGFGRIVVIMPLEPGHPPVLSRHVEEIGVAGRGPWPNEIKVALWGNGGHAAYESRLGEMQRSTLAQPYADDFLRHEAGAAR